MQPMLIIGLGGTGAHIVSGVLATLLIYGGIIYYEPGPMS